MHALLAQIHASPWLISPALAEAYLPLLQGLEQGRLPAQQARSLVELRAEMQPHDYTQAFAGGRAVAKANGQAAGSDPTGADRCQVRVISLSGPLLKDDQECGPYGLATYAASCEP